tara:strand:+ start:1286 stop:1435 length:150 start_codon:yes stop_codon:yes gene_type:complete
MNRHRIENNILHHAKARRENRRLIRIKNLMDKFGLTREQAEKKVADYLV